MSPVPPKEDIGLQQALSDLRKVSTIANKVQTHVRENGPQAPANFGVPAKPVMGDPSNPATWTIQEIPHPGRKELRSEASANNLLASSVPKKPGGLKP